MPIIKELYRDQLITLFNDCNLHHLGFCRQSPTLVYSFTIMCDDNVYEYCIEDNYSAFEESKAYDNYKDCYDGMNKTINSLETIDKKMGRITFLNDIVEVNNRQKEYWEYLQITEPYPNIKFKLIDK